MDQRLTRQIKPEMFITLPAAAGEIKHRDAGHGLTELMVIEKRTVPGYQAPYDHITARVICTTWEYNQAARMIRCYNAEPVITIPGVE